MQQQNLTLITGTDCCTPCKAASGIISEVMPEIFTLLNSVFCSVTLSLLENFGSSGPHGLHMHISAQKVNYVLYTSIRS